MNDPGILMMLFVIVIANIGGLYFWFKDRKDKLDKGNK